MIPSLSNCPRTLLNDCNHCATANIWRSAIEQLACPWFSRSLVSFPSSLRSPSLPPPPRIFLGHRAYSTYCIVLYRRIPRSPSLPLSGDRARYHECFPRRRSPSPPLPHLYPHNPDHYNQHSHTHMSSESQREPGSKNVGRSATGGKRVGGCRGRKTDSKGGWWPSLNRVLAEAELRSRATSNSRGSSYSTVHVRASIWVLIGQAPDSCRPCRQYRPQACGLPPAGGLPARSGCPSRGPPSDEHCTTAAVRGAPHCGLTCKRPPYNPCHMLSAHKRRPLDPKPPRRVCARHAGRIPYPRWAPVFTDFLLLQPPPRPPPLPVVPHSCCLAPFVTLITYWHGCAGCSGRGCAGRGGGGVGTESGGGGNISDV